VSETVETDKAKREEGWLSRLRSAFPSRPSAHREHHRPLTKKSSTTNARRTGGCADPGRSRCQRRGAAVGKLGKSASARSDRQSAAAFADDIAEILQPVAITLAIDPARSLCRAGGRRERQRQDHDHRQLATSTAGGRKVILAARHVPRRRRRSSQGVGRSRRRAGDRPETGADAAGSPTALERARADKCDVVA